MLRYWTAGESHGKTLLALVDGFPAGIELDLESINYDLKMRQGGYGRGGRQKIETDKVEVLTGIWKNTTMGSPVTLQVINKDYKLERMKDLERPRPGHGDLTGAVKYLGSIRNILERASARETAIRCAIGAICHQILNQLGVEIVGYVSSIGEQKLENINIEDIGQIKKLVDESEVSCPDKEASELMINEILKARKKKDTLGGSITLVAKNFPAGCGSYVHFDRKIDGRIALGFMSVQSVKAVSIGNGLDAYTSYGTDFHDEISVESNKLKRETNNSGGIEGGMTTGEDLVATAYLKPISTTLNPLKSVNLASGEQVETVYERSDTCAVPRAVPIFETVLALEVLQCLLEKTGGDNRREIVARKNQLTGLSIEDFNMSDEKWNMNYDI